MLQVPKIFDAETVVPSSTRRKDYQANLIDSMHFILHTLCQMDGRMDKREELIYSGGYNLNAKLLKSICCNHYKKALTILESNNVINIIHSYQPGMYSKAYSLKGFFASSDLKTVNLNEGKLKERYLQYINQKVAENQKKLDEIGFITKWFDPARLKIDIDTAHEYLEFFKRALDTQVSQEGTVSKSANIQNRINLSYNSVINAVIKVDKGDFNLYRKGKDTRLNSTVSSLKKEFRGFLRYDGEDLEGLDIMASQPYFLCQLVRGDFFKEGKISIETLYPELHRILLQQIDETATEEHNNNLYHTIMLHTYEVNHTQNPTQSFLMLDWTKDFYTQLIDLDETKFPTNRVFIDRSQVKKSMMFMLFENRKNKYVSKEWKRFCELFPVEGELIRLFGNLSLEHNENFLPILLQRYESNIFLDHVCKKISEQLPDAPLIPIHDSILTTSPFMQLVKNLIIETLTELTGITPGIKRDKKEKSAILNELEQVAIEEYMVIGKKRRKKTRMNTQLKVERKKPLLYKVPVLKGNKIISTKYIDPKDV